MVKAQFFHQGMHPNYLNPYTLGIEIFASLLIAFSAFLIYYKTKEIYQLTEHKGIKYFRKGFLFLGFSQLIKVMFDIFKPDFINWTYLEPMYIFGISLLFGLIGILYLLASMLTEKFKEYYIYILIIILMTLSITFKTPIFIGLSTLIIILLFGAFSIINYNKSKKKVFSQIYLIYLILFSSWLFMFLSMSISKLLNLGKFYNSIFLSFIFMYILYRIIHRLKLK